MVGVGAYIEAEHLLPFSTFKAGTYSRLALIQGGRLNE